jgi:hypothetical protein
VYEQFVHTVKNETTLALLLAPQKVNLCTNPSNCRNHPGNHGLAVDPPRMTVDIIVQSRNAEHEMHVFFTEKALNS